MKFLSRLVVLSIIFLLIQSIVGEVLRNKFHYADNEIFSKRTFYQQNKLKYNTIAVGSSRINRQLDVTLLDNIAGNISTFNFGIDGLFNPQTLFLADKILDLYSDDIDYLIVELLDIEHPKINNLFSLREYFYLSPHYYLQTILSIRDQVYKARDRRIQTQKIYTHLFIQSLFNLGTLETYLSRKNFNYRQKFIGHSGYTPLDSSNNSIIRMEKLRKDSIPLEKRRTEALRHLTLGYENRQLLNWYLALIEKGVDKGVHVIVLMTPRITQHVLSTYDKLPLKHKIRVSDPIKYPEFYYLRNSADEGHLNSSGARIFTREVAQKFNALNLD